MHTDPNGIKAEQKHASNSAETPDNLDLNGAEMQAEISPCCESAISQTQMKVESEINALKEQYARLFADMDNLRKRTIKDIESAHKFGTEKLLNDLLPVFDSLDAGLNTGGTDGVKLREGLELTQKQLAKAIESHGLSIVGTAGEAFNADVHQAVAMVESNEFAPGIVVAVFQKGFRLNGRLLRPAMVSVAKD